MNRLTENPVTAINSSFYKNVFLLTRVVPPSSRFQQHFKKDMFDKPNTAGFLHVSHYLSIIYNAMLFKQMVKWPIACKKDEATYRMEIRNFFSVLSQDNPDIKFPSILMSHLVLSCGTKFLTFMWKLSQLALRTYIKEEHSLVQGELYAPRTGPMDDFTITYFKNINADMRCNIVNAHEETKRIWDVANSFIKDEIKTLNMYKAEIFERKERLKELVSTVSVNLLIQERLMNVEDSDIIDLWKMDIRAKLQYICRKNEEFKKFEESTAQLYKIIRRIKSNSEILDANQFPKISCDSYLLRTQFYVQKDGSFTFSTLLSLLYMTLTQMLCRISADFSDISPYSLHIQNACDIMKSLQKLSVALYTKVNNMLNDEQCTSQKFEDVCTNCNTDNLPLTNQDTFPQSPKIKFSFNQCTNDLFHKNLCSPLMEEKMCSPSVNYEALNLTPKKRHLASEHLLMKNNGRKTRNLFDSAMIVSSSCASSDAEN
ncbi:hypothetical protein DMN91_001905 [Ooceraea biroi]|uniref:HAUS augmin-like complex subunit 6 N-terminal domain-containing protein n=1 Tax=Ooceraea biroi TaxID=2015173 RepID=A0A3L8DZ79_OOCBI|nr:hypothetical protein DMN91_001905 [Ooceraea biroi]